MRTPITYFGGKQHLASTILGMIPPHRIYVEPFFGGGAVFFSKSRSYLEVINDINDNLITFYEVCQDSGQFSELLDKVQHTLHSESLYRKAVSIWFGKEPSAGKVDRAWSVWMLTNISFCGSPGCGWKWDNGTSGSHSAKVMDHYRMQFTAAIHERLREVQISCRDALTVIDQRDREETFFFLDPPYIGTTQKHYSGYTADAYENLLEMHSRIKGKFLLCGFDTELLRCFVTENGWNMAIKDMPLRLSHLGKIARRKQEVMVYNYDIEPNLF